MFSHTRRAFLAHSSVAIAGTALGLARPASAIPFRATRAVSTFLPDVIPSDALRTLARAGIEAAERAGATYADIRVANLRRFTMVSFGMPDFRSQVQFEYAFGIRVRVGGAWTFVSAAVPTIDGVARAAQTAVTTARGLASVSAEAPALVPAPVIVGEWATPVEIDPFALAPSEHAAMLSAYDDVEGRVPHGHLVSNWFTWLAETRVFASSDGTLITQHLAQANPHVRVGVGGAIGLGVILPVDRLSPASAGFEITQGAVVQERIKQVSEEALRLSAYPVGNVEVGRYEAVLDGFSLGAAFSATLAPALELDRVLGHDTDGAGTSFLAPVSNVVGQPLFSPHLTVTTDRAAPHYGAARWDDEGVATEPCTIIERGRVVDYFTTRANASVLADWYAKRGVPLRSHGGALSWSVQNVPTGTPTHVVLAPGAPGATLESMVREMRNGVFVRTVPLCDSDPQLMGGAMYPTCVFEVKRGQITRRLRNVVVQFSTKKLWRAISVVGDASSVQVNDCEMIRGQPWTEVLQPVSAPAAYLRELDVFRWNT